MKTLYIARNGAHIFKEALRFIVKYQGDVMQEVPVHSIGQIVLIGKVEMTHDAMVLAYRQGIDVVCMSQRGELKAQVFPMNPKLVCLRKKQYALEPAKGYEFSKSVVEAKIRNSRTVLMKIQRRGNKELGELVWELKNITKRIPAAEDLEELRGVEGIAARIYYEGMRHLLRQDMGFVGRNKRPPKDPVNAMLSFGYVILYQRVCRFVTLYGLDPYMGHLHVPMDRRLSLPLDLMEEFRSVIIDRAVLTLVNRVQVTVKDFKVHEAGIRMEQKAIALLIKEIEARLEQPIHYPPLKKDLPWKLVIQRQVGLYRRFLEGELEKYPGFVVR